MDDMKIYPFVIEACEHLLKDLECDFVGLAIQNKVGPDVRWHYASGNRNEKYKRITVRYGKGIAGRVISTGSPMQIENFPNDIIGKSLEYPIFLAEHLVSAFAVPLRYAGIPRGVLLAGHRASRSFTESDKKLICKSAVNLEEMLADQMKF